MGETCWRISTKEGRRNAGRSPWEGRHPTVDVDRRGRGVNRHEERACRSKAKAKRKLEVGEKEKYERTKRKGRQKARCEGCEGVLGLA